MTLRNVATWAGPVAALLVASTGCKQTDAFDGVVDPSNFNATHQPNADVDGDGIAESILPREGYAQSGSTTEVVQFYDFGQVNAFVTDTDTGTKVVAQVGQLFRFKGESDINGDGKVDDGDCEPKAGVTKSEIQAGFDYDPRFEIFSNFRQHDVIDQLPEELDVDGDGEIDTFDYSPIVQVIEVTMPKGYVCNEVLNLDTLRLRAVKEDINGNGILDANEDLNGNLKLDDIRGGDLVTTPAGFATIEVLDIFTRLPDLIKAPVPDPFSLKANDNLNFEGFDPDGASEDIDLDLKLDKDNTEIDGDNDGDLRVSLGIVDGKGAALPDDEDADQDGHLDIAEDKGDGVLQDNEDLDGDGHLDINEDFHVGPGGCNFVLDAGEDVDGDGALDTQNEDLGDTLLQAAEDVDGDGKLDVVDEDYVPLDLGVADPDGCNGVLDVEDTDHDGNRDCGEVSPLLNCGEADVRPGGVARGPVTEDINGDGILQLAEDGTQPEIFGPPNGVLDTEDLNNDGELDLTEDFNGDGALTGGQGGIAVYDDRFAVFFKAHLTHITEFRPPTVATDTITNPDDPNDIQNVFTVETMRMFVDIEDSANAPIRPVFEFAPDQPGFQPIVEVVFFQRPAGVGAGAVLTAADILADFTESADADGDGLPDNPGEFLSSGTFQHAGFVVTNNDLTLAQASIFFPDTDGDGIPDLIEQNASYANPGNPEDADSNNDGVNDGVEDANRNGIVDAGETDPTL